MPIIDDELPLEEAYFLWLCSQVGQVEKLRNKTKTYWTLLGFLHRKEFTWSEIEKDQNRAVAGQNLRAQFLEASGRQNDGDFRELGCDMLEFLIAFAFDLAWDDVSVEDASQGLAKWFWILIDNLGLFGCNDAHPPSQRMFDRIIDRFITRDYDADGRGGLFPLEAPREDQRYVELHYQAQAYLLEKVPV